MINLRLKSKVRCGTVSLILLNASALSSQAARQEELLKLDPYPSLNTLGGRTLEGHLHVGWDTRYVSEGRDNLDGDSLFSLDCELGGKYFYGGLWYGFSSDCKYDELQFSLGAKKTLGKLEGYIGWTHVRTPFEGADDNEMSAGISYAALPWGISVSLDAYYSFNADGSFWELSLAREFKVTDSLSLAGMCIYGVNQGYISDGHIGGNHVAFRFEASYSFNDSWTMLGHLDFTTPIGKESNVEGDVLLKDLFHGGVSLRFSF